MIMVDVPKQIEYWAASSDEDFDAAQSLLEKGHLRHSLFFAHLAIEKMLKAHVTRETKDIPPRIHNLVRLSEMAGLSLGPEQASFLRRFDMYQLEGRYPESAHTIIDSKAANERLALAGDILKWLKAQL
jgi:HEPN domain-containing protein